MMVEFLTRWNIGWGEMSGWPGSFKNPIDVWSASVFSSLKWVCWWSFLPPGALASTPPCEYACPDSSCRGNWIQMMLYKLSDLCYCYGWKVEFSWSEVAQSCPTLCNPIDCSLPGSSVHRIFRGRVLEWVAISFSPEIEPGSPALQADALPSELPGKPRSFLRGIHVTRAASWPLSMVLKSQLPPGNPGHWLRIFLWHAPGGHTF